MFQEVVASAIEGLAQNHPAGFMSKVGLELIISQFLARCFNHCIKLPLKIKIMVLCRLKSKQDDNLKIVFLQGPLNPALSQILSKCGISTKT